MSADSCSAYSRITPFSIFGEGVKPTIQVSWGDIATPFHSKPVRRPHLAFGVRLSETRASIRQCDGR